MDGTLFLVVGDRAEACVRLVEHARKRFSSAADIVVPRRAITRTDSEGRELHQSVTPAQFDRQRRDGGYALCWGDDGANYGIPSAIDLDLAAGRSVLVTVPRGMVAAAQARYPQVQVIKLGGGRPRFGREDGTIFLADDSAERLVAKIGAITRLGYAGDGAAYRLPA